MHIVYVDFPLLRCPRHIQSKNCFSQTWSEETFRSFFSGKTGDTPKVQFRNQLSDFNYTLYLRSTLVAFGAEWRGRRGSWLMGEIRNREKPCFILPSAVIVFASPRRTRVVSHQGKVWNCESGMSKKTPGKRVKLLKTRSCNYFHYQPIRNNNYFCAYLAHRDSAHTNTSKNTIIKKRGERGLRICVP